MRYLKECGIISWYTMQGTPGQNSVGDRKRGLVLGIYMFGVVSCYFVTHSERLRMFRIVKCTTQGYLFDEEWNEKSRINIVCCGEVVTPVIVRDVDVDHQTISKLPLTNMEEPEQPQQEVLLRSSNREWRSIILDDYIVCLQEHDFDIGLEDNLISFIKVLIPKVDK